MKSLKALILAGGFGTRLRPLSCTRPKILFPIINKSLLQWILERLSKNGVREAILALNLQTEIFMKENKLPDCGLRVSFSRDPVREPLGTGGPIKKAEKRIGDDQPFFVLNGDIFADIDYAEILKEHTQKKATATIALYPVDDPSRYGIAELTDHNRIKRFIEKPPADKAPTNLANAGIYVLSPDIFEYIPKKRRVSIEREVFPKLSEEGKLYGHIFKGMWKDIGKIEDYLETNMILLDSINHPRRIRSKGKFRIKKPVAFDEGISAGEKSVIGPHVVLGRKTVIGEDVHIKNSVILPGTSISDFSSINGAVIGENVTVGKRVEIGEGCVLGDFARIADNVSLTRNVSVCPAKHVTQSVSTPKNII